MADTVSARNTNTCMWVSEWVSERVHTIHIPLHTFFLPRTLKLFSPICSHRCNIKRSTIGFHRLRLSVDVLLETCSSQNARKVPTLSSWDFSSASRIAAFFAFPHSLIRSSMSSCESPLRVRSCVPLRSSLMVCFRRRFSLFNARHFLRKPVSCERNLLILRLFLRFESLCEAFSAFSKAAKSQGAFGAVRLTTFFFYTVGINFFVKLTPDRQLTQFPDDELRNFCSVTTT